MQALDPLEAEQLVEQLRAEYLAERARAEELEEQLRAERIRDEQRKEHNNVRKFRNNLKKLSKIVRSKRQTLYLRFLLFIIIKVRIF